MAPAKLPATFSTKLLIVSSCNTWEAVLKRTTKKNSVWASSTVTLSGAAATPRGAAARPAGLSFCALCWYCCLKNNSSCSSQFLRPQQQWNTCSRWPVVLFQQSFSAFSNVLTVYWSFLLKETRRGLFKKILWEYPRKKMVNWAFVILMQLPLTALVRPALWRCFNSARSLFFFA